MESLLNFLLERFSKWVHLSFFRWRELRGLYESAIRRAKGSEALKQAATKILRSEFFDDFVRQRAVTPEREFAEFLRRMKEICPNADEDSIATFLESVYSELSTQMEKHSVWDERGDAIFEFLQDRRQTFEEAETVTLPAEITYTSHFVAPPVAKNSLDREDELQMLKKWLDDQQQTIGALVGIGGQGKTYLAAKLAGECSQNGWQVRWMELPKTADEFLRSIAAEMQARKDPYHSVVGDSNQPIDIRVDNAIRFLEGRNERWLFILDDFHKVGEDEEWQKLVVEMDRRCQRTKLLLTARREPDFPLKLPTGAHELQDVPPLPKAFTQAYLEACGLKVSQEDAERIWEKCEGNCEAMKLFAQAARRRTVSKLLTLPLPKWSANAEAWCEQLLADLGEAEKEAGKRLALFDEPIEGDLLLHLGAKEEGLSKLLDWRLAEILPDERYTLHEIVKAYWRMQTSEDEKVQWHKLAGEWLQRQAEMQEEELGDVIDWDLKEQKLWASLLRRAFWHFVDAGERKSALIVASLIVEFLERWGEWTENFRICQKAYELAKELMDEEEIAKWAHRFGMTHHSRGNYEEAKRMYRESLEMSDRLGNLVRKASTLHQLGVLAQYRGNHEEAERMYRESLKISERLGDLALKAATLHQLGRLAQERGNHEEAEKMYRESLKISERLGHLTVKAATLHHLGMLAQERGNYEEAKRMYRESLKISERLGDLVGKVKTLHVFGGLAQERGNYEEAERIYRESLKISEWLGDLAVKAATLHQLGILAQRRGNYEEAERMYRESLEISERLGDLAGKVKTLHVFGGLAQERGNYEEAERFIKEVLVIAEKLQSKTIRAYGFWALGQLRKAQGRTEEAREPLQQALSIFEQIGDAHAEDVRKELQDLNGT